MFRAICLLLLTCGFVAMNGTLSADEFRLSPRSQKETLPKSGQFERMAMDQVWPANETAIIVCDVWDKHHCLNAVRRMEEFVPRMNAVLTEARQRGAVIIHSPSDCMPAYVHHPARQRAINAPQSKVKPQDVEFWCSKIPAEEQAVYPIDQSDGGEDDDPEEHAKWAAALKALGRNPALPWKAQSPLVSISEQQDYISDRGDEVWNILEARGIRNVILVGVHTNMCVLGRPFGLRQMVRHGKNVVLMRDMTDCMYNPGRWPYVDHFTGNDLIISHVERYICPTVTSDQILGGQPFVSRYDTRTVRDIMQLETTTPKDSAWTDHWTTAMSSATWKEAAQGRLRHPDGPVWFRCTVRIPSEWLSGNDLRLKLDGGSKSMKAWVNGTLLNSKPGDAATFSIPDTAVAADDINLLVLRFETAPSDKQLLTAPVLENSQSSLNLSGRWQFRIGDDPSWSNIPLPAKFGIGSDVLFEVGP